MVLTADPEERILEYACHEGNRAMANTLSGARGGMCISRIREVSRAPHQGAPAITQETNAFSRSNGESGRDPSKFYIPTFRKSPYRYQIKS